MFLKYWRSEKYMENIPFRVGDQELYLYLPEAEGNPRRQIDTLVQGYWKGKDLEIDGWLPGRRFGPTDSPITPLLNSFLPNAGFTFAYQRRGSQSSARVLVCPPSQQWQSWLRFAIDYYTKPLIHEEAHRATPYIPFFCTLDGIDPLPRNDRPSFVAYTDFKDPKVSEQKGKKALRLDLERKANGLEEQLGIVIVR